MGKQGTGKAAEIANFPKREYKEMVAKASPKSKIFGDCLRAFFVGGGICAGSEGIVKWLMSLGQSRDEAGFFTTLILILLTALLTGLGLFDNIGRFSGAGTFVPITGFANSITSAAIEFKKEGSIFGIGAKIMVLAGPVVLYGVMTSVVVGFIYYFLK